SSDFTDPTAAARWVLVQKESTFGDAYNINTLLECD
ncbi:MAG: hypothetical protein ACJA00_005213, partial [Myxococcota bacterium]